ncbi:MAG: hypothetical protein HYT87_16745 [Nitrospirae bacterium]|nr:hypothetical protein [Nitrospirota bacterium]
MSQSFSTGSPWGFARAPHTDRGRITFRSLVHANDPLILIELRTTGDESGAELSFRPQQGISPRIAWAERTVEPSNLPPPPTYWKPGVEVFHLERYSTHDLGGGIRLPFVHELGNLTWALHNCWRQYRYSMDDDMLRDRFFPLLRGSINLFLHMLEEGPDGKLHLPPTHSPEFNDPAMVPDANYALGLLRWGLWTLLQTTSLLRIDDELQPRWESTLERLTDFPQDEHGLMIGHGQPLDKGHRHFSHLISIFPLHLLRPDDPRDRPLIERSFQHWLDLGAGTPNFNGYSYTAASSIHSSLGHGDAALEMLSAALKMFSPTTMYVESAPVIETPLSAAESIHDMLLQSHNGILRVLPAVPRAWPDVAFHDLLAEGAFLVSATRREGRTRMVRIRSLAGGICRLKTDLPRPLHPLGPPALSIREEDDGIVELDLRKGEEIVLFSDPDVPELEIQPVAPLRSDDRFNPFGVK